MAKFREVVITKLGLALITATQSGGTIEFTGLKIGNGIYSGTEVLEDMTALKSVQKTFGISGITRNNAVVKIRSVVSNEDVTEGYYITEIGLFAKDSNGTEILYAIFIAESDKADYFPPYEEFPQNMTLEIYISAAGVDESVTFTASIIEGIYATVEDLEAHKKNVTNPHSVTKSQVGLGNVPNVATNDQTPTYTAASSNTALTSGEKLSVAFGKIAKAISSLISHLADTVGHITSSERTKWNGKIDSSTVNATGLTDPFLTTLSISDTFTIQDLCNKNIVTFFTNWNDDTDFPDKYGCGVMFPCADPSNREIIYGGAINSTIGSYVGKAKQTNGVWTVTWYNNADKGNADTLDGYHASSFLLQDATGKIPTVPTFAGGVGNLEGGEIHLAKAPNSTIMTDDVIIDVVDKSVRIICQATSGIKISRIDFSTVGSDSVLLHTGVSVPVKIQDTAPTDTTALWIS